MKATSNEALRDGSAFAIGQNQCDEVLARISVFGLGNGLHLLRGMLLEFVRVGRFTGLFRERSATLRTHFRQLVRGALQRIAARRTANQQSRVRHRCGDEYVGRECVVAIGNRGRARERMADKIDGCDSASSKATRSWRVAAGKTQRGRAELDHAASVA
jgi:hypothetical protein